MSGSLSLQNQLLSTEQIKCSPSNKHGISNGNIFYLFIYFIFNY